MRKVWKSAKKNVERRNREGRCKIEEDDLLKNKNEATPLGIGLRGGMTPMELRGRQDEIFLKKIEEESMEDFKKYRRSNIAEMRLYDAGTVLPNNVSISEADRKNGSPKIGDMIARNPENHSDQWLVAKEYFLNNFEKI